MIKNIVPYSNTMFVPRIGSEYGNLSFYHIRVDNLGS